MTDNTQHANQPTYEQLIARIAELEAAKVTITPGTLGMKIGDKGGICVSGLTARFPVTLYAEQAVRYVGFLTGMTEEEVCKTQLGTIITENRAKLSFKAGIKALNIPAVVVQAAAKATE